MCSFLSVMVMLSIPLPIVASSQSAPCAINVVEFNHRKKYFKVLDNQQAGFDGVVLDRGLNLPMNSCKSNADVELRLPI